MKKLSKELLNVYLILLIVFALMYVGIIGFIFRYQYKTFRTEIYSTSTFLEKSLSKINSDNNIEDDINEIFKSSPKIEGMSIFIKFKDKIYSSTSGAIDFKESVTKDRIQNFYNFKDLDDSYWLLSKIYVASNSNTFHIQISKDLSSLSTFYTKIFILGVCGLLIAIVIALLGTKKILNSIKEQTDLQIDFVRNASHELKTPIFVLKGYSDLISKYGKTDENILNESIEAISEEIRYVETLLDKLLFLSKKEIIVPSLSTFDLNSLIEETYHSEQLIHTAQIFNYTPNTIMVTTDYNLLKQMLRNIIDNSIKYGNNNPIDIITSQDSNSTSITIRDRGIGIPTNDLDNIFKKFYRVNKSHNRDIVGHGLGLAIVATILDILDADIKVSSEVGRGTEVTIILK